jgi:hypothetical protein
MNQKEKIWILRGIFGDPWYVNYSKYRISLNYKTDVVQTLNRAVPNLGNKIDKIIQDIPKKKFVVKEVNKMFSKTFEEIKTRARFDFRLQISSRNCFPPGGYYRMTDHPSKYWSLIVSINKDVDFICYKCKTKKCNRCKIYYKYLTQG